MIRRALPWAGLLGLGLAALVVLPFLVGDYRSREFGSMGIYFVAILGLNILTGYSGQISIGHGAIMSLGGYTTAILATEHGIPDYWTIPLAGLLCGLAGLAFGVPALRLSGLYLALATFGIAVALPSIEKKLSGLTKGTAGIILEQHTGRWVYGVSWGIAVALLAVAWLLLRSRVGRAFRALRDSEIAAVSMGVDLAAYKTLAFGVSAFYAGVAGSLYAISTAYVNPDVFPIKLSIFLLVGAVIGGLGALPGLAVGAAFIQFVPTYAQDISQTAPSVVFGGLLVLVVLLLPTGAGGLLRRAVEPLANRLYSRS